MAGGALGGEVALDDLWSGWCIMYEVVVGVVGEEDGPVCLGPAWLACGCLAGPLEYKLHAVMLWLVSRQREHQVMGLTSSDPVKAQA